jgi:hypothetical protein
VKRSVGSLTAALLLGAHLAAAPAVSAEEGTRRFFRWPKPQWVLYSAAWIGVSIWAQPRRDFPHSFFSYVPATYTGLYLGATGGGLLGQSVASPSREGPNWGPSWGGMLIGGALGAGAGVALGYVSARNRPLYYTTQGAYVGVVMFTMPLVSF